MIKIVIIDDHPIVRGGIIKFLEKEKDFDICGEAESAQEAIKLINKCEPDLAIVDIALEGETDGIELIKAIKNRFSKTKVLCLSMFDEKIYAERVIKAGAKGYIQKNEGPHHIASAIRRIIEGKLYLSADISDRIISKLILGTEELDSNSVDSLSNREFEIFLLIGKGYSTKEIAQNLNLSSNTIESHKKKIKEKLDLKDAGSLSKMAIAWTSTNR